MNDRDHAEEAMVALRALGSSDPPREVADRVRAQAHGELEAAVAGGWLPLAIRAWTRVGLPVTLTATVLGYLAWAMSSATALYR
jgi:hypothetical protein